MGNDKQTTAVFESLGEGPSFHNTLCDLLEHVLLFRDLSATEVGQVAQFAHAYRVPPGGRLFSEGGKDSALFLIVSGRVRILKERQYKDLKPLALVSQGASLGEMSVVDGQPYSAPAVAEGPVTFLLITRHNFHGLVETHPALGCKLLLAIARLISLRLRRTSGLLVDHLGD